MSDNFTVRLNHGIRYGIDENGDEYTDITVTHVYSNPIPNVRPFSQTLRYMKALNLVEILQIVKADEAALKASIDSIGRAAPIAPAGRAGFVEIDRPAESS